MLGLQQQSRRAGGFFHIEGLQECSLASKTKLKHNRCLFVGLYGEVVQEKIHKWQYTKGNKSVQ